MHVRIILQSRLAENWVRMGAPRAKIVIGIAIYSRGFTLANANVYDVGAKTNGPSGPRRYTRMYGEAAYYEVRTDRCFSGVARILVWGGGQCIDSVCW